MKDFSDIDSEFIMVEIKEEVRRAGNLSCACEHLEGRRRKKTLEVVNRHLLNVIAWVNILKVRDSISTSLAEALEHIEKWAFRVFRMVCACKERPAPAAA